MKLQENLKAFVDGESRPSEADEIRKYLEETPEAQKEIDDLNRLSASIRAYVTQPEQVGLEATLTALEAAKPIARKQRMLMQQLRWVSAFAGVVVLIGLVGSGVLSRRNGADNSITLATGVGDVASSPSVGGTGSLSGAGEPPPTASTPGMFEKKALGGSAGRFGSDGMSRSVAKREAARNGSMEDRFETPPATAQGLSTPSTHAKSSTNRGLIEKDATLSLKVQKVAEAQHTVESVATEFGGYVERSNRTEAEGEKGEADITIRVQVQHFEEALKSIRGLGDVVSESNNGNDVTSDVVDMDARMKVLRAEEGDYLALLARARSMASIMAIKDKLTEIREEIESIDSQRKSTKDLAAYSTVNVHLAQEGEIAKPPKPEPEEQNWLSTTWSSAIDGLGAVGKVLAQLFIFVLVWSPLWLPVALFSAWMYRRTKW